MGRNSSGVMKSSRVKTKEVKHIANLVKDLEKKMNASIDDFNFFVKSFQKDNPGFSKALANKYAAQKMKSNGETTPQSYKKRIDQIKGSAKRMYGVEV